MAPTAELTRSQSATVTPPARPIVTRNTDRAPEPKKRTSNNSTPSPATTASICGLTCSNGDAIADNPRKNSKNGRRATAARIKPFKEPFINIHYRMTKIKIFIK
jgi:hypothetical protein